MPRGHCHLIDDNRIGGVSPAPRAGSTTSARFASEPCFSNLKSIPGSVDAVLLYRPPQATESVVRECADLGIVRVWIHRSIGGGSRSGTAERVAHERGLTLIPGGCPAMFCSPDIAHKCLRWVLNAFGRLPKDVPVPHGSSRA